jgi:hypothetical protein
VFVEDLLLMSKERMVVSVQQATLASLQKLLSATLLPMLGKTSRASSKVIIALHDEIDNWCFIILLMMDSLYFS